jgi:ribosomal protein S6--L-glutamate ligase
MLDVKGRPRVFEVNSSPSIREAEACGADAAARIVDRAVALAEARRAVASRRPRAAAATAMRE